MALSDDRDRSVLADWANHPGHQIMRQRLLESRDTYFTQLGKALYADPASLTEADLTSKAAFFRGALWILNQPVFERKALERSMALDEGVDAA